ncbi:hypothetical protein BN1221_04490 [Brenneria goodwinii]|uniref:Uncharacterized protein n=1 Tax=Brenneria goodwinii TaxID=1109412 RepID=A0A0G4K1G7_9GAMM|nr:hypothetical protein BN1221_04490 [Brenneria goodwinii]
MTCRKYLPDNHVNVPFQGDRVSVFSCLISLIIYLVEKKQ